MIGIVLAAGAGSRYGRPKAGVVLHGERLVDRAVRVLHEAGVDEVIVVLGAEVLEVPDATVVTNPQWHTGMASSLQCGLAAARESAASTACILLVDLVDVGSDVICTLASDAPGVLRVATYRDERGHPVVIGREHWDGVAAAAVGDRGARAYLDAHRELVDLVEVGHLATGMDLDHPPSSDDAG